MKQSIPRNMVVGAMALALTLAAGVVLVAWLSASYVSNNTRNVGTQAAQSSPTRVSPPPTPGDRWNEYASHIRPVANIRAAERLPAYPNAEEVRVTPSNFLHQPNEIEFYTSDSLEEVAEFYTVVLARQGWTDGGGWWDKDFASIAKGFAWPVDQGDSYKLLASFLVSDGCLRDPSGPVTDENSVKKRCVNVELRRQPFESRIPLYPGAQDVNVQDNPHPYATQYMKLMTRTTRYKVNVSPQEVERFYRTTLADNGWASDQELMSLSPGSIETGILFIDPTRSEPRAGMPPEVTISARPLEDGPTEVTLVAEGPELKASSVP
jgi:hypothetical protein